MIDLIMKDTNETHKIYHVFLKNTNVQSYFDKDACFEITQ